MMKSVNKVIIGMKINASQKDDELNITDAIPDIYSPIGKIGQTYNLFTFQEIYAVYRYMTFKNYRKNVYRIQQ